MGSYYCYEKDCPGRTEESPWPKSDSVKGRCKHCKRRMTGPVYGIEEWQERMETAAQAGEGD